ncbi:poly(ethylene terephthalate) hydrolase family protein [Psychrobacter sp. DM8]|uniref:poly(ethylene terephthalate) hydrolase family protein n=1 Tax=Psychrobacter sp. DM8 TaxID=3440636 RepID=UPI003F4FB843
MITYSLKLKATILVAAFVCTMTAYTQSPMDAELNLMDVEPSPMDTELSPMDAKLKLSNAASAACIADSDISADNMTQTRGNGPFTVMTKRVPRKLAQGFGGGTIHYPVDANGCGSLAAIAVVPGYVSYESSIKWWGPRLASWGFVVITINTHSIYDKPDSRADQLSAALDHVIEDSTVGSMIDPERLGAIGWSMGGGGALKLAGERDAIRAIIPAAPYYDKDYGTIKTPTLIIACQNDRIARNEKYTNIFYNHAAGPKMKIEVNNASHFCPSYRFNEKLLSTPSIAWMQRYLNNDTRFDQFLCGNKDYSLSPRISAYDYAQCL